MNCPGQLERGIIMRKSTPWGAAQDATTLAEGIISYSTAGHGGIWLSAERREQLIERTGKLCVYSNLKNFLGGLEWWEEDCDWAIPYYFFREEIGAQATGWELEHLAEKVDAALKTIKGWHKEIAL